MSHQFQRAGSGIAATGEQRRRAEPISRESDGFPDELGFTPSDPCYNVSMATKPHNPNPAGRKGLPISLAPLNGDEALAAALRVKPEEVKRIQAATPRDKARK
jgi:hypothetical protein